MRKLTVDVIEFHPLHRNTLRGFCTVYIGEMHLTIHDIGVHQHASGARWVALPAKPLLESDGTARRDDRGKIAYCPVIEFADRETRDAFAARVIAALLEFAPDAFNGAAA